MRILIGSLIIGVLLSVSGFLVAVVVGSHQTGKIIFLFGFFLGALSSSFILASNSFNYLGNFAIHLKIVGGGFGIAIFGKIVGFVIEGGGGVASAFFVFGMVVMVVGVIFAVVSKIDL